MITKFSSRRGPRPVLRQRRLRAASGSTRASSSRSTTTSRSRASTRASSSTATPSIFKGKDGKTYGFPKDGNTIAHGATTPTSSRPPPTTIDELVTAAEGLKGQDGLTAPMCLNPGLDRGLAFLYAQGGELADRRRRRLGDRHRGLEGRRPVVPRPVQERPRHDRRPTWVPAGAARRSARSTSPSTFEGGWLDPFMTSTYPGREVRLGRDADRIVRQPGDDLVHRQLLDRRGLGRTRTRPSCCSAT